MDTQQHNLQYAELENPRVYWGPWDTEQHNIQYVELENPHVYWGPGDTQQHNLQYVELENPRVYWSPWDTQQHNSQYAELELVGASTFYDLKEKRLSIFDIMYVYYFLYGTYISLVGIIHSSYRVALHCITLYNTAWVKSRPGNFTFAVNSNQSNNNITSCTSLDLNRTIFFLCLEK